MILIWVLLFANFFCNLDLLSKSLLFHQILLCLHFLHLFLGFDDFRDGDLLIFTSTSSRSTLWLRRFLILLILLRAFFNLILRFGRCHILTYFLLWWRLLSRCSRNIVWCWIWIFYDNFFFLLLLLFFLRGLIFVEKSHHTFLKFVEICLRLISSVYLVNNCSCFFRIRIDILWICFIFVLWIILKRWLILPISVFLFVCGIIWLLSSLLIFSVDCSVVSIASPIISIFVTLERSLFLVPILRGSLHSFLLL